MMKFILTFTLLMLLSDLTAQSFVGGNFEAEIGASYKEMTDGGCMIYTYRVLRFTSDSVTISYKVVPHCIPEDRNKAYQDLHKNLTKTYKWTILNNLMTIENFDYYGKLTVLDDKLIGWDNTKAKIEFYGIE